MKASMFAAAAAIALLAGAANAGEVLVNGSFEQPPIGYPGYIYPNGTADGWTYDGNGVLINVGNGSAWGAAPANRDGDQFAGLQGTGSVSQTFNLNAAGAFALSWLDAGRPSDGAYGGDQTYEVLIDGAQVGGVFSTSSGTAFSAETLSLGDLSAGQHTLEFLGTDLHTDLNNGDNTAFIDKVSIAAAVPEPATWAMLMLGLGLIGLATRRRGEEAALAA